LHAGCPCSDANQFQRGIIKKKGGADDAADAPFQ
jgi:hypothetical protein